jgi:hypothetical protein
MQTDLRAAKLPPRADFAIVLCMKTMLCVLTTLFLLGCATFEQTPGDVQDKISQPTKGHFYERDPEKGY